MSETYSVLPLLTLTILIPPSEILRTGTFGFIDFASLVLWSLEVTCWFTYPNHMFLQQVLNTCMLLTSQELLFQESERHHKNKKEGNTNAGGFFSTLPKIPHIGKTKVFPFLFPLRFRRIKYLHSKCLPFIHPLAIRLKLVKSGAFHYNNFQIRVCQITLFSVGKCSKFYVSYL